MKRTTLGENLEDVSKCEWTSSPCFEPEAQWRARTRGQVVATESFKLAQLTRVEERLRRLLSIHDVQAVVTNTRAQVARPTTEQLVEALRFYVLRDAFITRTKGRRR